MGGASSLSVLVRAGEMLCLSIDRMRHATFLPVDVAQDAWHAPPMNVDVAWDVLGVAADLTPKRKRGTMYDAGEGMQIRAIWENRVLCDSSVKALPNYIR